MSDKKNFLNEGISGIGEFVEDMMKLLNIVIYDNWFWYKITDQYEDMILLAANA